MAMKVKADNIAAVAVMADTFVSECETPMRNIETQIKNLTETVQGKVTSEFHETLKDLKKQLDRQRQAFEVLKKISEMSANMRIDNFQQRKKDFAETSDTMKALRLRNKSKVK